MRRALALTVAGITVAGWSVWGVYRAGGVARAVAWILNQPAPAALPVDPRTVAYKTAQERFRTLDFAIARALINLQAGPDQVRETQSHRMTPEGGWLPAKRTIRVAAGYALTQCNLELTRSVTAAGGRVVLAEERPRTHELILHVAYDGYKTHELTIIRDASLSRKTGHMAIVIDGLGKARADIAVEFLAFPKPLTFAILPGQPDSERLAAEAVKRDHEVLSRALGATGEDAWGVLDAVDNQARIAQMLDLASYAALERGDVIVVGHARPNTLAVLLRKVDRLTLRGIQFVHVSALGKVQKD